MDQAGLGEAAKPQEINVAVVVVVEARDEAGQHAAVWGVHVASDQGDPYSRERMHPKASENFNMGVASPNKHQILPCRLQNV